MTPDIASHDLVSTALAIKATNPKRLFKVEWDGQIYWLKQREQTNDKPLWLIPQRLAADLLRLPILRPTTRRGGVKDLKIEEQRIRDFLAAGLPAPQVVASGSDYFILKDAGTILPKVLPTLPEDAQRDLLRRALKTLQQVHAAGQYHGRPMIKDMVVDAEGRITLLDFEETPLDVMSLAEAQARDLLVFLSSIPPEAPMVGQALAAAPEVRDALRRVARLFGPVAALLAPFAKKDSKKAKKLSDIITLSRLLRENLMNKVAQ